MFNRRINVVSARNKQASSELRSAKEIWYETTFFVAPKYSAERRSDVISLELPTILLRLMVQ